MQPLRLSCAMASWLHRRKETDGHNDFSQKGCDLTMYSDSIQLHTLPYLAALLGCTEAQAGAIPLTFQTFDDEKPNGVCRPEMTRLLHGSLSECWKELERINIAGAGIFVTVNTTDLTGRKKGNVIALRGHWADIDLKDDSEPFGLDDLPLAPTMVVGTPGGWHPSWLFHKPLPCESDSHRSEHEAELRGIQAALARFGADPKVCDVSRVMRLPGFLHRKGEPRLVELVIAGGPRWNRDEVRTTFPIAESNFAKDQPYRETATALRPLNRPDVMARAAAYLDTVPPSIQLKDGSGDAFKAALKVITRFALTEDEAVTLLWERFNERCLPPWTVGELKHKVSDALRSALASPDWGCAFHGDQPRHAALPETNAEANLMQLIESEATHLIHPDVPGFEWNERGLYLVKSINPRVSEHLWLTQPFALPELVRNGESDSWRMSITWKDPDEVPHAATIPFEWLSGEGPELARLLAQGGFVASTEPTARKGFVQFLSLARLFISCRVRLVDRLGWNDGSFVLPTGETIGGLKEAVRFSGAVPGARSKATNGSLKGWQDGVAKFAVGNPHLAFGMACAFAGPLLELLCPDRGGGFNLQGQSSQGKSTALVAGLSIWQNPMPLPTWRGTSNGLGARLRIDPCPGFLPGSFFRERSDLPLLRRSRSDRSLKNGGQKYR